MTNSQRIALNADWWPKACRAQGWKAGDRDLRLRVCAWAVSLENPTLISLLEAINSDRQPTRVLQSANDLDNKEDVTIVKNCLGMLSDQVNQAQEVGRPEFGRARTLRFAISEQLKCLALYPVEQPMGLDGARKYLGEIIKDKFRHGSRTEPLTIKDLTADPVRFTDRKSGALREIPSQLDQVVMSLARAIQPRRAAAGHSLHEMKLMAGVWCGCKLCGNPPMPPSVLELEIPSVLVADGEGAGVVAGDPDWNV